MISFSQVIEKSMLKFHLGRINEAEIVAVYSGVCKVNAAIAAQVLIDLFHVDCVVNAGTAGGMEESVRLFDTVVSERMVYHDVAEDVLTEFHPWLKENCFTADPRLLDAAKRYKEKTEYPILFGVMATGNSLSRMKKGRSKEFGKWLTKNIVVSIM